jgi:colanic acid biosynthesis glycosyl transferase WcaI
MRVLILGFNYLPESTSIGPYTADLAEFLVLRGHDVKVICGFPMAPGWTVWRGYRGFAYKREVISGVDVLRTWAYIPSDPRRASRRIAFDTSFAISALFRGIFAGPCDVVVVISPPLQLGLSGWLLALLRRASVFFHIQDLVPDAAVAIGALRPGIALKLARMLEKFVYRHSHRIGVICDGFSRNLIAKDVPPSKVTLLPDYVDLKFMGTHEPYNSFRKNLGLSASDFIVMYSGSVAGKQGLETFVNAAFEMRSYSDIKFLLVGEGPYLPELKNRAREMDIPNLRFLPLQPRDGLSEQLAAADVLVITQKRTVTDIVFPGKLLYYMAAARPILASVNPESETGRFILSQGVGVVTPPEDAQALAEAVLRLRGGEGLQLGRIGRRVVEERFDRNVVLPDFERCLERLCERDGGRGRGYASVVNSKSD